MEPTPARTPRQIAIRDLPLAFPDSRWRIASRDLIERVDPIDGRIDRPAFEQLADSLDVDGTLLGCQHLQALAHELRQGDGP